MLSEDKTQKKADFCHISLPPTRWLTVIVGEEFPIDLRMLKSFRCLRPLKMVSKVPSKLSAISLRQRRFAHRTTATQPELRN